MAKHFIKYKDLRDCYYFRKGGRVYAKVTNACAIDERNNKDSVFAPYERVEPIGPVPCSIV